MRTTYSFFPQNRQVWVLSISIFTHRLLHGHRSRGQCIGRVIYYVRGMVRRELRGGPVSAFHSSTKVNPQGQSDKKLRAALVTLIAGAYRIAA